MNDNPKLGIVGKVFWTTFLVLVAAGAFGLHPLIGIVVAILVYHMLQDIW